MNASMRKMKAVINREFKKVEGSVPVEVTHCGNTRFSIAADGSEWLSSAKRFLASIGIEVESVYQYQGDDDNFSCIYFHLAG